MTDIEIRICTQCGKGINNPSLIAWPKQKEYKYNNFYVCENCYNEISDYVKKGWRYEDFWQVEQKYPRIFKQGMYKNKIENRGWAIRLMEKIKLFIASI